MIKIAYQLTFHAVSHIGTGEGFAGFLDSIVVRDSDAHVYVPGSSIKGKTRAAARRLAQSLHLYSCPPDQPCPPTADGCIICAIFGSSQRAGRFYFDNVQLPSLYKDLLADVHKYDPVRSRELTTDRRTQVMLSRQRRSARPDHLFTSELMQPDLPLTGSIVGNIVGQGDDETVDIPAEAALLWGALESITHMGKSRSRGWGRCSIGVDLLWRDKSVERQLYIKALRSLVGKEQA